MKKIVYLIASNDMDGRGKTTIEAAFWEEDQRDTAFRNDKYKAYRTKLEQIVDVEKQTKEAESKLDGLDKLLLKVKVD